MSIVTGDRYLESLVKFVENVAGPLIEGTLVLKLNPVGLHYVQSRLEALAELESLLAGAPVDYLRAYVSDLGDHRALEQLRRILRLLTTLKVVSVLPPPVRDPTPLSLLPFGRLRVLELRGCDLSTSAARGLLELRHTLEKLICHNSTDALRHVFASRIAEIKDSPNWNRLNFVSCACNGLFLMDESLQLLPVVETLDLSRNKFTKVDNLRKCTKLKHLDLGFNQLRTIVSLNEVYRQIVKLVLRNNALTTLRGIENLQSLEGLDLSYNILSNFSELEILSGLLSLKSLWLEGNPLCSARWYRPQVFSFFPHPDELELDDKKICTREFWKRQIIIASRQKRPASFGFYFTAKDDAGLEGTINTKRKKLSRLADIESEGQSTCVCSDQESVSCDNEVQGKEENVALDDEAEIVDLMNRIEFMKKERSNLWLEEFKEWMNQASDISVYDGGKYSGDIILDPDSGNYSESKTGHKHLGESSRYVADSVQSYGEENSMNIPESDNSVEDMSAGFSGQQYIDRIDEAVSKIFTGHAAGVSVPLIGRSDPNQDNLKSYYVEGAQSVKAGSSHLDSCTVPAVDKMREKKSVRPLAAIDDIMESYSSSACLGSPPHYQEDILQRRQNLEEEFLQLSAESYSIASSDSNTSYSDDDSAEFVVFIPQDDPSLINELSDRSVDDYYSSVLHSVETSTQKRHNVSQFTQNGKYSLDSRARQNSGIIKHTEPCTSPLLCHDSFSARAHDGETVCHVKQEADSLENKKCNRRSKRRVISLTNENNMDDKTVPAHEVNGSLDVSRDDVVDERMKQVSHGSDRHTCKKALATSNSNDGQNILSTSNSNDSQNILSETKLDYLGTDDIIMNYFSSNVADSVVQETCRQYMCCNCILEEISECKESEVAVLQSSEQKLYMLLISSGYDGSEITLSQIGCHKMEDVKEAIVGLGLQVVRVYIGRNGTYRFVTRSLEKSRQLFCILDIFDSYVAKDGFSIRSFEQVQVDLFVRRFFRGSNVSIFQYSMVLFWSYTCKEDLWLSRSLFVLERHLLVCIEDLLHFGSFSKDSSYSSYFSLDSCCSIVDVQEMPYSVVSMAQSPSASSAASTTSQCSVLKRASDDVGWEYGFLVNPSNKDRWRCKLCDKEYGGGVYRLKQHIANIKGNIAPCSKSTKEDKEKCKMALDKAATKKRDKRIDDLNVRAEVEVHAIPEGNEDEEVEVLGSRKRPHYLGPIDRYARAINPDLSASKKMRQQNMNDALWKERTHDVNRYLARWMYETGIPFHGIDNDSFKRFVEAVGIFGQGYQPPSQYQLREPLLKEEVERTKQSLKKQEEEWASTGCSIMTDVWADRKRSIMNLCVNCRTGTCFLSSKEDSEVSHTTEHIFGYVDKCIDEVGTQNVIQVVTDNASNNMAAAELLKAKRPHMFWTSCVTHNKPHA